MSSVTPPLSNVERLILLNQYRLLKDLQRTSSYDALIEALVAGDSIFYRDALNAQLHADMAERDQQFVIDVLWLYQLLQQADASIEFPGFDGNFETSMMSFARREIARTQKTGLQLQTAAGCNSQQPMSTTYGRQLAAWVALGKPQPLTREHIAAVIGA